MSTCTTISRPPRRRWFAGVAALLLGACGGSGGDPTSSNVVDADPEERSGPVGGDGVGTSLEVADGTRATYRGAVVHRTDSGMASNPVRTTVYAVFDVSIPDGERQFFSYDGFVNTAVSRPLLDVDASPLEPCENPASPLPQYNFGQAHRRPEFGVPGPVTLTFVHCFSRAGFEIGVDELAVSASLYHGDGSDRATLAVAGATLEADALADVATSIAWLHDHVDPTGLYSDGRAEWEPNVFGRTTFEKYYGDGLEDVDTVGQGAPDEPGDLDAGATGDDPSGETIAPPPTIADQATIDHLRTAGFDDGYADGYASGNLGEDHYLASYDDPDPDLGEYDVAYEDGYDTGFADGDAAARHDDDTDTTDEDVPDEPLDDTPGDDDGDGDEESPAPTAVEYPTAFGPAADDFAEFEVVRSIVEGMQSEAHEFQVCSVTPAGYPCIEVRSHTHANERDHRMVVSVRLGAGTEQWDRDVWLLIINADPATEPWIVVEDWWVDTGEQPGWAM